MIITSDGLRLYNLPLLAVGGVIAFPFVFALLTLLLTVLAGFMGMFVGTMLWALVGAAAGLLVSVFAKLVEEDDWANATIFATSDFACGSMSFGFFRADREYEIWASTVLLNLPAAIFVAVICAFIFTRKMESAFATAWGNRVNLFPCQFRITLSNYLLYIILSIGLAFAHLISYFVADIESLNGVNENVNFEITKGMAFIRFESAKIIDAVAAVRTAKPVQSVGILAMIVVIAAAYFGVNWFVSRSITRALSVLVTALILNGFYIALLQIGAMGGDAIPPWLLPTVNFVVWADAEIANALISLLSSVGTAFEVDFSIAQKVFGAGPAIVNVLSALIDASASVALVPSSYRSILSEFREIREVFEARYFFFLIASGLMWGRVVVRGGGINSSSGPGRSGE